MITRIVRMTFRKEEIETFQEVFHSSKELIASFPGCKHLELHQQENDPRVFFTISRWESLQHLEDYRNSDLFMRTWAKTKILFEERPSAWSLEERWKSR